MAGKTLYKNCSCYFEINRLYVKIYLVGILYSISDWVGGIHLSLFDDSPWVPKGPVRDPYPNRRPRSYRRSGFPLIPFVLALVLLWIVWGFLFYTPHNVVATVCSKERAANGSGGEYRVYTADSGTYVIKDTHWFTQWRTDSADVYARLHPPGTYKLTYVGWRFSPLSLFPNIADFKKLRTDERQLARCSD
jgi:hypothetical protein